MQRHRHPLQSKEENHYEHATNLNFQGLRDLETDFARFKEKQAEKIGGSTSIARATGTTLNSRRWRTLPLTFAKDHLTKGEAR